MIKLGDFRVDNVEESGTIPISTFSGKQLASFLSENNLSIKPEEAKSLTKKIGRDPTLTEIHVFNIEWSEHTSYKSSRDTLKLLPATGKNVILGPSEDSGIVELGTINNDKWGVVISHESHNHPSQVVPYEGAATGIGGDIRDVVCMGAKVVALADPLRFGNPTGPNKERVKYISNSVVNGIAGYSNAVGIPNMGGDAYFEDSFDDNCLVNVVCLGIVKAKDIIHSTAPKNSEGYDVVIVGKPTDTSGFGGAAFASLILDDKQHENKGAVQVPDPFLKNVLIRASYAVFDEIRKRKIEVGFKDMGAGGIMCAASELASSAGYGVDIDLDKVHVSMENLPPYIIACGETQERFTWIVPPEFTPILIKIYNENYDLPNVAEGARAVVIGKITKEKNFVLRHNEKIVCNVPVDEVTSGIKYARESKEPKMNFKEPSIKEPRAYNATLLKILAHRDVCSREMIYKHYDTSVMGNTIIAPGEADAGLISPEEVSPHGIALSTDSNPRISKISPYWGAANAVAESMANIAAIGAIPSALTDCLNYGNPEIPENFWQFQQGVQGVADAANNIHRYKTKEQVPVVSGNVSFYNSNSKGKPVDPSAIISCVGVMDDYSKAITTRFKKHKSFLYLLGKRKDELGGSVYYDLSGETGANVPKIDFEKETAMIHSIIDMTDKRLLLSCHDISDGGMAAAISEMAILGEIGAQIDIAFSEMRYDKTMFSENSGFIIEVDSKNKSAVKKILSSNGVEYWKLGQTTKEAKLVFRAKNRKILDVKVDEMASEWYSSLHSLMKQ